MGVNFAPLLSSPNPSFSRIHQLVQESLFTKSKSHSGQKQLNFVLNNPWIHLSSIANQSPRPSSSFFNRLPHGNYQKLTFQQWAHIFKSFLPENSELPKTSPPYFSAIFPKMPKQVISMISCLLEYQIDQWVDEAILGFMSVFSSRKKPSILFLFQSILLDVIHEKFNADGSFKHQSVLVYLFLYHQLKRFKFPLQKLDSQGRPQSVIH